MLLCVCVLFASSAHLVIGDLPNEQHGIDGNLYVVDSTTLRFEDFDYDGQGPGTFCPKKEILVIKHILLSST